MQAAEYCEIDVECGGFSFSMGGMNTDLPMEDGVLYYRYIVPIYGSMVRTKEWFIVINVSEKLFILIKVQNSLQCYLTSLNYRLNPIGYGQLTVLKERSLWCPEEWI